MIDNRAFVESFADDFRRENRGRVWPVRRIRASKRWGATRPGRSPADGSPGGVRVGVTNVKERVSVVAVPPSFPGGVEGDWVAILRWRRKRVTLEGASLWGSSLFGNLNRGLELDPGNESLT